MATDAIVEAHMQMAQLSEKTKAILRDFLPAAASVKNPVDMIASAPLEHYRRTVSCVLADPGVDMVIVIYLPFLGLKDIDVARELSKLKADYPDKPIVGVFMTTADFFSKLGEEQLSVPFYMYAEKAVQALKRLNRQRLWVQRPKENFPRFQVDKASVASVLKQMRAENRLQLSTRESLEVLRAYGVRTCHEALAHSEDRRQRWQHTSTRAHKHQQHGQRRQAQRDVQRLADLGQQRDQALARIGSQSTRAEREAIADVVIDSEQPFEQMFDAVDMLVAQWRSECGNTSRRAEEQEA